MLTDHACRCCGGRVLAREGGGEWICADCEVKTTGGHASLCCCGLRMPSGRDPHVRCVRPAGFVPGLGRAVLPQVG